MRLLAVFVSLALLALAGTSPVYAQDAKPFQAFLQDNAKSVERPSRKSVQEFIDALLDAELPQATDFLGRWRDKQVWLRKEDGLFFYGPDARGDIELTDMDDGAVVGTFSSRDFKQIKPNSGVRGVIGGALVQFQLSDPDVEKRRAALLAIERRADASQLAPLRTSIDGEEDATILARKQRLERLLTIRYGETSAERVEAIEHFAGDTAIDVRAALNPLLSTRRAVSEAMPEDVNVARQLSVGGDIDVDEAYAMLVEAELAPPRVLDAVRDAALVSNAEDGVVAGVGLATLDTAEARDAAYARLAEDGQVAAFVSADERASLIEEHVFYEIYAEADAQVTASTVSALSAIERNVGLNQVADLGLDALSLASIYFLAAIGLAITFGVMGVINMAHGEFIMMGAYTGYVVQLFVPDYTVSIIIALPLAFAVTFAAGVAMERLVIRHLMHRPLETLLATFGISIALQQLAKNIFGTQARPLTAPSWLDGSLVFNDIVSISYIRIAIFVLAAIFFVVLLFILNRTRLGLEVRAVTQNPSMASSMGINPDRINMLTFGLGSGIAGIAGVAIGLFAQVTSEMGANYIVQSFMTVVVGGVGNIFGTLAGAGMIGSLQKVIEFFNPANTLAAQTYMIIFIIIFIQFRPKGIIALKGRAAGD
ncbi:MAG: urea ABC transporter permease subunit UrtB [Pseudomonadota bacterium]